MSRKRCGQKGWARLWFVTAVASGLGCNVLFGINQYGGDTGSGAAGSGGGSTSQGGSAGNAGGGGSAGNAGGSGSAGSTGSAGSGGMNCEPLPEDCDTANDEACNGPDDCGTFSAKLATGDADPQFAFGIAVNAAGNPIVVGGFRGTINLGCAPSTNVNDGTDIFVARLTPTAPTLGCAWATVLGQAGAQVASTVVIDQSGNPTIAGTHNGGVPQCGLLDAGSPRTYVASLSDPSEGACAWARELGNPGMEAGLAVDADKDGDVFVASNFTDSFTVSGCPSLTSSGSADISVLKLTKTGVCQWNDRFGDSLLQAVSDAAVDMNGDVIVTGRFAGTLTDTQCAELQSDEPTNVGGTDIFLMKLDGSDGSCRWIRRFGDDTNNHGGISVATDSIGNIILVSHFENTVDFGGGPMVSAFSQSSDTAIAKFYPDGSYAHQIFLAGETQQVDVTVDSKTSNIVIVGSFKGSLTFEKTPILSAGGGDIFVAKLDPDLKLIWSKRVGDMQDQAATGVTVDGAGSIYLTGHFNGTIDFGDGAINSAGGNDVFVAKLSK